MSGESAGRKAALWKSFSRSRSVLECGGLPPLFWHEILPYRPWPKCRVAAVDQDREGAGWKGHAALRDTLNHSQRGQFLPRFLRRLMQDSPPISSRASLNIFMPVIEIN